MYNIAYERPSRSPWLRLKAGVNQPLWRTDRAALFAADRNNRTSVRGDHLFSWQVGPLIGLLMLCEWAGAGQKRVRTDK